MTTNNKEEYSQPNGKVNNGQKVSSNDMPFHKNAKVNSEGSDVHIKTRCGRIVRKPDRLMY